MRDITALMMNSPLLSSSLPCPCTANAVTFLEETHGLAHGRLDVQRLDVLPVLLEQGDEEVDACRNEQSGMMGIAS